ncbi:hypothetical protein SAMN05444365_102331 [Micromonospora pattaloongensis]|uniref:Uncharacterized protein n=1 Tax=Micromonospora pattaloongensis TaxID=405436 RepID=A0A1H3K2C2_9ACTN|nr:hypothetical protein [Micromonospora pattaloongensis]SDY45989.1 hypothetical protein SAMN05444365_102331 [Micromonospora pattaloongensis]
MSTELDASGAPLREPPAPARPRHARLPWVVAILAATVCAVLIVQRIDADGGPADLRGQLASRMVTVLEQTPPDQHHGHGEHVNQATEGRPRIVCGVRVFGFEPATADRLDAVRTVYGHHLCAVAQPGLAWDGAVKLVGPLVLDLSTDPPTIEVAEASATVSFRDRVRQLIPERYQEQAFQESLEPATMTELRRRYDEAARG